MRKSTIGLCLALPVAALAFACSSSDDSSSSGGGAGGTSFGGSAQGGAHAGGSANGGSSGASTGGTASGGSAAAGTSNGGSAGTGTGMGEAGSGEAGAGEAGSGNTAVPPANAVYSLSNDATANAVFGFTRAADGTLTPMSAAFPTLGTGTGVALGSEGSLAYDTVNDRLYAVNAGDNSFSIFPVATAWTAA